MTPPKADKAKAEKAPRLKRRAFLVAVKQKREATRVYAVLVRSADEAISLLQAHAAEGGTFELAGTLSGRMARSLKLKPNELRLV